MKTSILLLTAALTLQASAQLALIRQGRESAGTPGPGDRFGFVVCAGDFNRDGYDDLATGAPYEQIGDVTAAQAGFVTINRGSRNGLTWVNAMGMSPGGSALASIREQHTICEAPLPAAHGAPFPMLVAIEDRGAGRQVRPANEDVFFTVTLQETTGEVVLLFSSLSGGSFYDAFDVQWSADLTSAAWQRAARLPANATGSYQWNGTVPPQERRRFFRITGVPAE